MFSSPGCSRGSKPAGGQSSIPTRTPEKANFGIKALANLTIFEVGAVNSILIFSRAIVGILTSSQPWSLGFSGESVERQSFADPKLAVCAPRAIPVVVSRIGTRRISVHEHCTDAG